MPPIYIRKGKDSQSLQYFKQYSTAIFWDTVNFLLQQKCQCTKCQKIYPTL